MGVEVSETLELLILSLDGSGLIQHHSSSLITQEFALANPFVLKLTALTSAVHIRIRYMYRTLYYESLVGHWVLIRYFQPSATQPLSQTLLRIEPSANIINTFRKPHSSNF